MGNQRNLLLTGIVVVAFLGLSIAAIAVSLDPQRGAAQSFTEFYVLNAEGNASDYPTNLTVGESTTVRVGVVNRENKRESYTVLVRLTNRTVTSRSITLDDNERWEHPITFAPRNTGPATLYFQLYRGDEIASTDPYRTLRLSVTVSE